MDLVDLIEEKRFIGQEFLELKKNKDNYITRMRTLLDSHQGVIKGFEDQYQIAIGQSSAMFSSNLQSTQLPQSISRGGV